jgi:DnaD/phage-associated family protein
MPSRILKESICYSENLDKLTSQSEILFYRLIVNCDDYGRMDGRLSVIRSKCFPLRTEIIKQDDISEWLTELINNHLVKLYTIENHDYIEMITWGKHQQIRAKKSKYPSPDTNNIISNQLQSNEIISNQLQSNESDLASNNNGNQLQSNEIICPRNPIQSNKNPIQSDESVGLIFKTYESEIGILTGMVSDTIKQWILDYPKEWIIEAIKESSLRQHRNAPYIEKILTNWKIDGKNNGSKPTAHLENKKTKRYFN